MQIAHPKDLREYLFLFWALEEYFAFKSSRLPQHSVNPRALFLKVRITWGGRHSWEKQISGPHAPH